MEDYVLHRSCNLILKLRKVLRCGIDATTNPNVRGNEDGLGSAAIGRLSRNVIPSHSMHESWGFENRPPTTHM
jgi:hypothetical protein